MIRHCLEKGPRFLKSCLLGILYFDHVYSLCQNFFSGTILKYKKDRDIWLIFEGLFIVLRREKECCNSTPKVYYPQLQLRLLEIGDRLVLILAGSEADTDSKLEYLKTNAVLRQVLSNFQLLCFRTQCIPNKTIDTIWVRSLSHLTRGYSITTWT